MFGKKSNDEARFDRELFSMYDSKTGLYREPIMLINQLDVLRQMDNMFRDEKQAKNPIVLNAEDYSLFRVGYYDVKTGEIKVCKPLEHVANMHDIRSAVQFEQQRVPHGIPPQVHTL